MQNYLDHKCSNLCTRVDVCLVILHHKLRHIVTLICYVDPDDGVTCATTAVRGRDGNAVQRLLLSVQLFVGEQFTCKRYYMDYIDPKVHKHRDT